MAHRIPQHVTREDVLAAVAECDKLGTEAFLTKHGFGPSKRYQLRFAGRSYPSKAVLGVAAGLNAAEFSGGAAHTCRVLTGLRFHVRDGERRGLLARLRGTFRKALAQFRFPTYEPTALPVDPVASFASGSNCAGDIRGFAAVGHDVGVAFPNLNEAAIVELESLAGSDIAVFVDSGAFSEVEFNAPHKCGKGKKCREGRCPGDGGLPHPDHEPFTFVTVAPLDDAHWNAALDCYERLACALGDQLHVVAPDKVGDQKTTLRRLARYTGRLATIAARGARVLVPIQKGALTQAEFYGRVSELLEGVAWTPALPCKKAATTVEEAREFAAAVQPRHLHLLGLGAGGELIAEYLGAVSSAAPSCLVQIDSCVIRSLVGRSGAHRKFGTGGVRRMTHALDIVTRLLGAGSTGTDRKNLQIAVALA